MIFSYKNKDIFYETNGDKNNPPLVILNGIMMSTKSWEIFVKEFSKQNYLIRFDMIDQGQSSNADNNYTQSLQVEVLYELLTYLNLPLVHMVGISYGASVALQFALKYQHNIDKLVIANGVAKTSKWLKAIGEGWNEVAKTRNGLAYYNISIPYIYSPTFYDQNIEWMEKRKELLVPLFSNPSFLDRMIRLTTSSNTHDVTSDLRNITTDTLIISSEMDYLTPPFEQQYIHKELPHSKLVTIPNCGHASMYEEPELFTSLVLGHINKSFKQQLV
jgi:pimeloyl-ACP methyl ester carboxylesterase